MDWEFDLSDFEWDGMLTDVHILETSEADWNRFLALMKRRSTGFRFVQSSVEVEMPDSIAEIFVMQESGVPCLHIDPDGMKLNCHFFSVDEIEFDFDVRDFVTAEKRKRLSEFIETLCLDLGKVAIVAEGFSYDYPKWQFDPTRGSWLHGSQL